MRLQLFALLLGLTACQAPSTSEGDDAPPTTTRPPRPDAGNADAGDASVPPEPVPRDGGSEDAAVGPPTFPPTRLATYLSTACVLTSAGTVRCAGVGRLASDVPGLSGVTSIAGGELNACALVSDGKVWCWGSGRLGDGALRTTAVSTPVLVKNLPAADAITVGSDGRCARARDGRWWCWGANENGELGDGTKIDRREPVSVPIPANAISVAVGGTHTCYALASGAVRCAGLNDKGQLGDGTQLGRAVFADVVGAVGGVLHANRCASCFSGDEKAGRTTCVLSPAGTLQCWGQNIANALGDGSMTAKNNPVANAGVTGAKDFVQSGLASCVLDGAGKVTCWGKSLFVGVRNAADGAMVATLASGAAELAATSLYTCARKTAGGVVCWAPGGPQGNNSTFFLPTEIVGL